MIAYQPKTILVVDDNIDLIASAVNLLKNHGYETITAENAAEALNIIESGKHVDLIFTDVVMPGNVCSVEMAARARYIYPHIKVIFTSGYRDTLKMLLEDEVFLLKPYEFNSMLKTIEDVLNS